MVCFRFTFAPLLVGDLLQQLPDGYLNRTAMREISVSKRAGSRPGGQPAVPAGWEGNNLVTSDAASGPIPVVPESIGLLCQMRPVKSNQVFAPGGMKFKPAFDPARSAS